MMEMGKGTMGNGKMIVDNNNRTLVVITDGAQKGSLGLAWPKRDRDTTVRVDMASGMLLKDPGQFRPATLAELRVG